MAFGVKVYITKLLSLLSAIVLVAGLVPMQALWAFDMPDAASATTDNTQEASAEQDIFPANRIIVSLEDGVGLYGDDHDNVVSSDENTYILEYGDVDEAQDAYLRYDGADGVSFAAADVVLEAADDGTAEIPAEAPAAVLEDIEQKKTELSDGEEKAVDDYDPEEDVDDYGSEETEPAEDDTIVIALIDTAVPEDFVDDYNCEHGTAYRQEKRTSAIGGSQPEDVAEDVHGAKMLETILDAATERLAKEDRKADEPIGSNIEVVSIEALDARGHGSAGSVYAALALAAAADADIVNMSFAGYAVEGNSAIKKGVEGVIEDARADGRAVAMLAAAGNKNMDSKYFVPVSYDGVVGVGALDTAKCDAVEALSPNFTDYKRDDSNYGEGLLWTLADSTSYAAAKATGTLSSMDGALGADDMAQTLQAALVEGYEVVDDYDSDEAAESVEESHSGSQADVPAGNAEPAADDVADSPQATPAAIDADPEIVRGTDSGVEAAGSALAPGNNIARNASTGKLVWSYSRGNLTSTSASTATFTASAPGFYKLEVWGAQGGYPYSTRSEAHGGYGGYAYGTAELAEGSQLHIALGGTGSPSTATDVDIPGGYNGGGVGRWGSVLPNEYFASGGGATHIADVSGTVKQIGESYRDSSATGDAQYAVAKSHLYVVAGGGGGAGWNYTGSKNYDNYGGNGGGTTGGKGTELRKDASGEAGTWDYCYGLGGTQTEPGHNSLRNSDSATSWVSFTGGGFGYGGNISNGNPSYKHGGSGGGGGLYGGGASFGYDASAGGGSGYVNPTLLASSGMTAAASANHTGAGEARITWEGWSVEYHGAPGASSAVCKYDLFAANGSTVALTQEQAGAASQSGTGYGVIGWSEQPNARAATYIAGLTPITKNCVLYPVYGYEYPDRLSPVSRDETTGNMTWNVNRASGTVFSSGSSIRFTPTATGPYKLEVWGAQGGSAGITNAHGGYGGYAYGTATLTENTPIFVTIGGRGTTAQTDLQMVAGGYNGGGTSSMCGPNLIDEQHASGGGATHIATLPGTLQGIGEEFIDTSKTGDARYTAAKSQLYLVAGGGGGGGGRLDTDAYTNYGGNGGGETGGDGMTERWGTNHADYAHGLGATQTAPGANALRDAGVPYSESIQANACLPAGFGYGSSIELAGYSGSGGGGGLYGGGGSHGWDASAGGGSGYLSPTRLTDSGMSAYTESTHEGDGAARITWLGKSVEYRDGNGDVLDYGLFAETGVVADLSSLGAAASGGLVPVGWALEPGVTDRIDYVAGDAISDTCTLYPVYNVAFEDTPVTGINDGGIGWMGILACCCAALVVAALLLLIGRRRKIQRVKRSLR